MSIRATCGAMLRRTLGGARTEKLRRREVGIRQSLARRIAPAGAPATASASKKSAPKPPTPAAQPAPKAPAPKAPAPKAPAKPKLTRAEMIAALGEIGIEGMGAGVKPPGNLAWVSPDPYEHTSSGMHKHNLLAQLHELLQPRTYFEIGVDQGQSLTLSRCRSIGVDPAYRITRSVQCDVRTFLQTSDDFFAAEGNFDHFAELPVDLAFIDGMHLAEFALRDFINIEKRMSPGGVVVLDDMMPRNSLEAQRVRRTVSWAGDVYKVHEVLRQHRPDLTLLPINTQPTGSYLVVGLDPTSTVLADVYDELLPSLSAADPQTVDSDWSRRTHAYDPTVVVESPVWARLRLLRDDGAPAQEYAELWESLRGLPQGPLDA